MLSVGVDLLHADREVKVVSLFVNGFVGASRNVRLVWSDSCYPAFFNTATYNTVFDPVTSSAQR